jgi:hypothetical protein
MSSTYLLASIYIYKVFIFHNPCRMLAGTPLAQQRRALTFLAAEHAEWKGQREA